MRHLLNTLFVFTEDSYLALEAENVVVLNGDRELGRFPLLTLENILSFSYRGASPALMGACAQRNVALCFFSPQGRFLARVCGQTRGNVLLRKEQYRRSDSPEQSCLIARNMIAGKLSNSRWVLERATRDHPLQVDVSKLKRASGLLLNAARAAASCEDLGVLRGLEGEAATRYFDVLDQLILQNKADFSFQGRSRRPPLDPVNALLSYGYTLLAHDCAAALEAVGLDPYVGFLHRDRPGRTSLALDLMEELRAIFVDRLAITLINVRTIQAKHFQTKENGAVWLTEDGRKAFTSAWQNKKRETLVHPYLNEKVPWGLIPYIQALLLVRFLRGDLDAYPPFLWK
ncbi:type I-C CRISPR-associated endonuclease Cas1 [Clostridiaceae bacterium NSJ-31]|uniref:CRISPR-associated endonuclease Cas1 n=2 Tax=Ligaoa zhengdingensis TaxID=2763658 RepID=A0A926I4H5_9FIRM|nr:type I-C CRISPR-associated endonuclease Cas1c [Ligaoa zhengdingensis]MBC8546513.1 type I-C CRISPR-associated endonuclease Cas1 [Ligaoa zhengdingensis]